MSEPLFSYRCKLLADYHQLVELLLLVIIPWYELVATTVFTSPRLDSFGWSTVGTIISTRWMVYKHYPTFASILTPLRFSGVGINHETHLPFMHDKSWFKPTIRMEYLVRFLLTSRVASRHLLARFPREICLPSRWRPVHLARNSADAEHQPICGKPPLSYSAGGFCK